MTLSLSTWGYADRRTLTGYTAADVTAAWWLARPTRGEFRRRSISLPVVSV